MYIISGCLLGHNCKYDGGNNRNEDVIRFCQTHEYIIVCPERAGGLPAFRVVDYCYDVIDNKADMMKELQRKGGLVAHFGTADSREVEKLVMEGDAHAKLIYDAMILNIAKNIAKLSVDVYGKVDYIVLTGGIAFSKYVTEGIKERVGFIAPVEVVPGEKEMDSLAFGALRVLDGTETARLLEKEE